MLGGGSIWDRDSITKVQSIPHRTGNRGTLLATSSELWKTTLKRSKVITRGAAAKRGDRRGRETRSNELGKFLKPFMVVGVVWVGVCSWITARFW